MKDHIVRVMVVDDDPAMQQMVPIVLRTFGQRPDVPDVEVKVCSCAIQALTALHGFKAHCIVSDLQMPGCNGIDFAARVKSRFGKIPILLITASEISPDLQRQAHQQGVECFLSKKAVLTAGREGLLRFIRHKGEPRQSPC